jgi:hypothetical protein
MRPVLTSPNYLNSCFTKLHSLVFCVPHAIAWAHALLLEFSYFASDCLFFQIRWKHLSNTYAIFLASTWRGVLRARNLTFPHPQSSTRSSWTVTFITTDTYLDQIMQIPLMLLWYWDYTLNLLIRQMTINLLIVHYQCQLSHTYIKVNYWQAMCPLCATLMKCISILFPGILLGQEI